MFFYVIWFDSLHNMYPDDRYGVLRKVKQGSACCKDRNEELARLRKELENSKKEAREWAEFACNENTEKNEHHKIGNGGNWCF